MNKHIKKLLCAAVSLAMAAGTIVLPMTASADGETPLVAGDKVLQEWKFSFGTEAKDGFTRVAADRNVVKTQDYGFIGNDASVTTNMEKYDSFKYKAGMVVNLKESANGVGIEKDETAPFPEFSTGDYFPVSFGLYVKNNTYYRVHAEVTTLDSTKSATASLYYERRHPAMHKKAIEAGQTVSVDFSVDVETINFKNEGNFVDDMLNIALLGDNAALSSLTIQQIDTNVENPPVTLWVIGDSTVTDGSADLPYFDLQNYTGVGAYLSKYVPSTVAVSNQGEGGLNATDNNHFNIAKEHIKKNDFMYVEYGHNHKDDSNSPGPVGYLSCLSKYYEACEAKGATLVMVGPIDRHNYDSNPSKSQYDPSTNTWTTTLAQFSKAAKYYVDMLKYAGEDKTEEFLKKVTAEAEREVTYKDKTYKTNIADTTYAWADEAIAAGKATPPADAASNVAFVDLNKPTLDWLSTVTASGTVKNQAVTNDYRLANFYFQTSKGGTTDGTHPNDAGADALAQKFFTTADVATYPALAPLMTRVTNGNTDVQPVPVSADIINLGYPSNDAWPTYQSLASYEFATRITDVAFDEDGTLKSVDVLPLDKSMMSTYSRAYFALYNKETGALEDVAISTGHVDNTQDGTQTLDFDTDVTVGANQTYKVFLWGYEDDPENGNPTTMQPYAYPYTPIEIGDPIITNGTGGLNEAFVYEGVDNAGSLDGKGGWTCGGSHQTAAETDFSYNEEGNMTYAHVSSNGTKADGNSGSAYVYKKFTEPVSTGRIMMDFDFRYKEGTPNILFVTKGDPWTWPASLSPFKVAVDGDGKTVVSMNDCTVGNISPKTWTHIHYELDLDEGFETMSIDGGKPVKHDIAAYQTTETTVSPASLDQIVFEYVNKAFSFDFDITNLKLAKLKKDPLPKYTMTVTPNDAALGSVSFTTADSETPVTEGDFDLNTIVTVKAEPAASCAFLGWLDEAGKKVSEDEEYTFRLRGDTTLTADFVQEGAVNEITAFELGADKDYVKTDSSVTMKVLNAKTAEGAPVFSVQNTDVTWATDVTGVEISADGVVTFTEDFEAPTGVVKVEIKGTINGVTKSYTITAHLADYYNDFAQPAGTMIVDVGETNGIISNTNKPYSHLMVSTGGDNGNGGNITPIASGDNFAYYSAGFNQDNYNLTFDPAAEITKFAFDGAFGAQTWAGGTPSKRGTEEVTFTLGNLTVVATPTNKEATATTGTDALKVTVSDGTNTKTATSETKQLKWAKYSIEIDDSNAVTVKITPSGGETETITGLTASGSITKGVFSGSKTASFGLDNVEIYYKAE